MPKIGSIRRRVALQSESETADGQGGYEAAWTAYATVWGRLRNLRGNERREAAGAEASVEHEVTIRYRSDVTAAHRIVIDSLAYNIRAVTHDERKRWSFLRCETGVAI